MRSSTAVLLMLLAACSSAHAQLLEFGDCSGNIDTRWLEDGRKMKLLADYVYTDAAPKLWLAPKGAEIDGASIPQALWSFIGGPFEGLYRKASVVHDVACDEKKEPWRAVHRMFYDAMRCSKVTERRAKIMYWAVYHCGPRWGSDRGIQWCSPKALADNVRRLKEFLRRRPGINVGQLQEITDKDLASVEVNLNAFAAAVERLRGIANVVIRNGTPVVVLGENWLYEPGKRRLTQRGATRIEEVAAVFADLPDVEFLVTPISMPTDTKTQAELSGQRATAVAEQLAVSGVRYSQISLAPAKVYLVAEKAPVNEAWQEVVIREGL